MTSAISGSGTYSSSIYPSSTSSGSGGTVAQTSNSALSQEAISLSNEASFISSIGGGSSLTYSNPLDIFNSIAQAGTSSSGSQQSVDPASVQSVIASTNNDLLNSLSSDGSSSDASTSSSTTDPSTSGIYSQAGILQNTGSQSSSSLAAAIKANPSLAAVAVQNSLNEGFTNLLSAIA